MSASRSVDRSASATAAGARGTGSPWRTPVDTSMSTTATGRRCRRAAATRACTVTSKYGSPNRPGLRVGEGILLEGEQGHLVRGRPGLLRLRHLGEGLGQGGGSRLGVGLPAIGGHHGTAGADGGDGGTSEPEDAGGETQDRHVGDSRRGARRQSSCSERESSALPSVHVTHLIGRGQPPFSRSGDFS